MNRIAVKLTQEAKPQDLFCGPLFITLGSNRIAIDEVSDSELTCWLKEQKSCSESESLKHHHKVWLSSGSRVKADAYRDRLHLTFTNYGEVFVGKPVDWSIGEDGRANLSWQLHSFFFLRDFAGSYELTKDPSYLLIAEELVREWANCALVESPLPRFAWNDHSTAYRIHALTQYFNYLSGLDNHTSTFIAQLYRLIVRHQAILLTTALYSKGTNHGLDQAFYLYVSSVMTPAHGETDKVREVALNRLQYEMLRSFAPDGVHIENSPKYHDLVLASTTYMGRLVQSLEGASVVPQLHLLASEGIRFLSYILRPDGLFPPIGDSTQIPPRSAHQNLANTACYSAFQYARSIGKDAYDDLPACAVFPDSGYAIFRGKSCSPTTSRIHFVFKCGYLSNYHRHDDDNGVVLYADGEDWLVDGSLFRHEELELQRKFLRSARAHCLMLPLGCDASRDINNASPTGIVDYEILPDHATVQGQTRMFPGFVYERTVCFDLQGELIQIDDVFSCRDVASADEQMYELLFHIPMDKSIQVSSNRVCIKSDRTGRSISIVLDENGLCGVSLHRAESGSAHCRRSIAYNRIEEIQTICAVYAGRPGVAVTTCLNLSELVTFERDETCLDEK